MKKQTQNTGTQNQTGTEPPKKEEGAYMTTKSMQMSRSSITNTHAKHKKIIDAEERQAQSDDMRLCVTYRIGGSDHIPRTLKMAKMEEQLAMVAETAARAIRNQVIRAADAEKIPIEIFYESMFTLYIGFDEPIKQEEEHGKN